MLNVDSHRRQLMASLRRALRIGERMGDFVVNINLRRRGRCIEMLADVRDPRGEFQCRSKQSDWRSTCRDMGRTLSNRLHDHSIEVRTA